MLTAAQVATRSPAVVQTGLRAGLWSPTEVTVDPRQVVAELPDWLARTFGVEFAFGTPVLGYDRPSVRAAGGEWIAQRLAICTGADFRDLAPAAFADVGFVPCKLQMMRTPAYTDFRLGPLLAAGLTLRHYKSFAGCLTLPALAHRFDTESPDYGRYGIHVMAAQNGGGEVVIGDSHEYGAAIEPFDKPAIDQMILDYLNRFVRLPDLQIAARWHGVYVKHPTEPFVVAKPAPACGP